MPEEMSDEEINKIAKKRVKKKKDFKGTCAICKDWY